MTGTIFADTREADAAYAKARKDAGLPKKVSLSTVARVAELMRSGTETAAGSEATAAVMGGRTQVPASYQAS